MFTREQSLGVLKAVGRDAQLMDFAQKLIDDGIVTDVDTLELVAGNAMARAALGLCTMGIVAWDSLWIYLLACFAGCIAAAAAYKVVNGAG